jgi:hypothetical protein
LTTDGGVSWATSTLLSTIAVSDIFNSSSQRVIFIALLP